MQENAAASHSVCGEELVSVFRCQEPFFGLLAIKAF